MEKISSYQLFTLVFLYEIGSTIIFGFASSAGRDAWISVLISTFIGVIINIVYYIIFKLNRRSNLIGWFLAQFGIWIGTPIAYVYALEFIYDGSRGLADLEILLPSTILPKTPVLVIEFIFIFVITYALISGIEVIARLGEIFFPTIIFIFIIEVILICNSNMLNIQYIRPVLGKGWGNVWKAVWPLGITQTFGQTIEFTMLWPLVKKPEKIIKITTIATILAGVFIAFFDILSIMALGENTFSNSNFPLYRLIRLISVGDFIENLDAIGVIYFLTTAFFKASIHFFCATQAIEQLTFAKNKYMPIFIIVVIGLYLGLNMASSAAEHLQTGLKIVPLYLWIPLFYVLPIILLIVTVFRNKLGKKVKS